MSRQASLPPRCPFQKKPLSPPTDGSTSRLEWRHHRSSSQSFIPEEQPAWFDDLLNEPDSNLDGRRLRRSASDSATFLDNMLKPPLSMMSNDDEENHNSNHEMFRGLESACVYGPNSPRQRDNSPFLENAIVSAFSEYTTEDPLRTSGTSNANSGNLEGNASISSGELNPDTKLVKRHPGQRSRVRKLQYIAELEQTVKMLQNLESDLAARAAAMLRQRTSLSIENSKLKQQLIRLQQKKLVMEGEYRSLKNEAERLRMGLLNSPKSMVERYLSIGLNAATNSTGSKAPWDMPDIGKLRLN